MIIIIIIIIAYIKILCWDITRKMGDRRVLHLYFLLYESLSILRRKYLMYNKWIAKRGREQGIQLINKNQTYILFIYTKKKMELGIWRVEFPPSPSLSLYRALGLGPLSLPLASLFNSRLPNFPRLSGIRFWCRCGSSRRILSSDLQFVFSSSSLSFISPLLAPTTSLMGWRIF